jgi:hypothetical protein
MSEGKIRVAMFEVSGGAELIQGTIHAVAALLGNGLPAAAAAPAALPPPPTEEAEEPAPRRRARAATRNVGNKPGHETNR